MSLGDTIYFGVLVERPEALQELFDPKQFITIYLVDTMNGFQFEAFLVETFQAIGYDVKR